MDMTKFLKDGVKVPGLDLASMPDPHVGDLGKQHNPSENVVVLRCPAEAITAGGIVLPDIAQDQQQVGWVISVGSKVEAGYQVGDIVQFPEHAFVVHVGMSATCIENWSDRKKNPTDFGFVVESELVLVETPDGRAIE